MDIAAYCFCGCGRRVRFGRKRASGHGAEVRRLLAVLETVGVPTADAQGTAHQRSELTRLITDGGMLDSLFQNMAHGLPVTPPPISGISGWFQDANVWREHSNCLLPDNRHAGLPDNLARTSA